MGATCQRAVQPGGDLDGSEIALVGLPVPSLAGSAKGTAAGYAVIGHDGRPKKCRRASRQARWQSFRRRPELSNADRTREKSMPPASRHDSDAGQNDRLNRLQIPHMCSICRSVWRQGRAIERLSPGFLEKSVDQIFDQAIFGIHQTFCPRPLPAALPAPLVQILRVRGICRPARQPVERAASPGTHFKMQSGHRNQRPPGHTGRTGRIFQRVHAQRSPVACEADMGSARRWR